MPYPISLLRARLLNKKSFYKIKKSNLKIPCCKLKLATGSIKVSSSFDWGVDFTDPEIRVSLHRWGWLLRLRSDNRPLLTRSQGLALIRSWLQNCNSDHFLNTDAYSAAERIVNSIIFLQYYRQKIPDDILKSFKNMIFDIARNIEYFESNRTGNHAFNNGRGLFFAGVLTNSHTAVEFAYEIFKERLSRLVTDEGFLCESSSHYHFLFTRWVLEIYWLAKKYNQLNVVEHLTPYAKKLVKRCWFFLINDKIGKEWSMPLVGDISPDFPPGWLIALPWSKPALAVFRPDSLPRFHGPVGWASFFGIEKGTNKNFPEIGSLTFPKSSWHRIVCGELILFVHAEATDGKMHADHRHLDLGGFVLYRSGRLIIADSGRVDYTGSKFSEYGKGASSHNTLFIDGLAPTVDSHFWAHKDYKSVSVSTRLIESKESTIFYLQHNGFNRIKSTKIGHTRQFTLTPSSLRIDDIINGATMHNIVLRFHFPPQSFLKKTHDRLFKIQPFNASLLTDQCLTNSSIISKTDDCLGGYFSNEYGIGRKSTTLELTACLKLPMTISNTLDWS